MSSLPAGPCLMNPKSTASRALLWMVPIVLFLAACSQQAELCSRPDQHPDCASELQQRLAEARVPGVSVAIIDNRRLVSQWTMGDHADQNGRLLSSVTPFQAGDLTQVVTAMGVLAWLQQADIPLDTAVNEGLDNWQIPDNSRWSGDDVTVRHLLSHRSGLTPTRFQGYRFGERQPNWDALLNGTEPARSAPVQLAGQPGQTCHSSAAAYEVLAYWLENQTGDNFSLWQSRTVLTPLNIPARYRLIGLPSPALGHDWRGETLDGGFRRFVERASSGLWASPSDLARVLMEIMAAEQGVGRVLTDSNLINEMLSPQGCGWGLGMRVERMESGTILSAEGITPGYRSRMIGHLQDGHGVVVMTNGDRGDRIIDDIVAAVRRDYNW
ncbi:class A beta-lactamase-related serine hydrolase [Natronospirillum operosum]|uniref:Class A beta-lactamase-related serine hydrolase n=1 Tax=Natronospirillum operosum TaxID=2759953 RepID=A0A4Z0W9I8_9GAMM|nr:serine hydrolase domain-containing protein [Natronospirillum operosum]TGG90635.1 class A beta-lactamase-related serine hydrolase [Natronospirillum operosum]